MQKNRFRIGYTWQRKYGDVRLHENLVRNDVLCKLLKYKKYFEELQAWRRLTLFLRFEGLGLPARPESFNSLSTEPASTTSNASVRVQMADPCTRTVLSVLGSEKFLHVYLACLEVLCKNTVSTFKKDTS